MSQYRDLVLATAGLVHYWRLGESVNTAAAVDLGPTPNNGAYTVTPTVAAAGLLAANDPDTAMTTNGTSRMQVASAYTPVCTAPNGAFALECWISFSAATLNAFFVGEASSASQSPAAYLAIDQFTAGLLRVFVRNDAAVSVSVSSARAYNDGKPHHVVASSSGTLITLYVDGVVVGTTAPPTGTITITQMACGGFLRTSFANGLAATYDEVAFYSQAVSAADVRAHLNTGRAAGALLAA